jgi:hypothetical protein
MEILSESECNKFVSAFYFIFISFVMTAVLILKFLRPLLHVGFLDNRKY